MPSSVFAGLLQRVRSRPSMECLRPAASASQLSLSKAPPPSALSSVFEYPPVAPVPAILRNADVTSRIVNFLVDLPGGKKVVSRLARTCKAFFEPAADALWKELDSLVPLIGLFPGHLLRRAKRPGLGLAKVPEDEDWARLLFYGERVRKLTYNESFYNISPAVFPIIDEYRPVLYILPNLDTLIWRCETQAGLDRSLLFLNPQLENFTLDIGMRIPKLDMYIEELPRRAKLISLAITSVTPLPSNFADSMQDQLNLERVSLNAPGSLSPDVGRWATSLPKLRYLQLDLTAHSSSAIESFFANTELRSGYTTPSSVGGTDSGVFSGGEDMDFTDCRKDLRKFALRVTEDYTSSFHRRTSGAFPLLDEIRLTGDVGGIAAFLKHVRSDVSTIDLTIDDPPQPLDWRELCAVLHHRFCSSLQTLHIAGTNSSRPESIRAMSRGEVNVIAKNLSLREFPVLPSLQRLEIDLPQSVLLEDADAARLALACPALRVLRLCPSARFPISSGPPRLTSEGLAHLMRGCRQLHTLAVVFSALPGSDHVLDSRICSSDTLLRLHVGHSWAKDALQTAILLSHLAPHLTQLKFANDASRIGHVASHANAWQQTATFLPHLQRLRAAERRASQEVVNTVIRQLMQPRADHAADAVYAPKLESIMEDGSVSETEDEEDNASSIAVIEKVDQAVDATPRVAEMAVGMHLLTIDIATSPILQVEDIPARVDAATSPLAAVEDLPATATAEDLSASAEDPPAAPVRVAEVAVEAQPLTINTATSPIIQEGDLLARVDAAVSPFVCAEDPHVAVVGPFSDKDLVAAPAVLASEASSSSRGLAEVSPAAQQCAPLAASDPTPATSRNDGACPMPPPPTCSGDPTIPPRPPTTAFGGGFFALARDAVVTLPLYASLLAFNTSLSLLGAQPKRAVSARSRSQGLQISPICV